MLAFHRSALLIKIECLSTHASMRIGVAVLVWRFPVLLLLHCLVRGRGGTVSSKGLSSRHVKLFKNLRSQQVQ